ncbi:TasA family protein [Chloroflexota bacterium]
MKKILGLTVAALLVMGLVGGGTWAYFSDPETSTGNILTAGTLDLTLNGGDSDVKIIDTSVSNIYPGASSSNYTTLVNAGSLAGELEIEFSAITNTGLNDGSEFADNIGHVGGSANLSVWIDVDGLGVWNSGDIDLESDGTAVPFTTDPTLDSATIDSFDGVNWNNVYGGSDQFAAAASDRFYITYVVPTSANNTIQGDSASWDITFTLEQGTAD